MWNSRYTAIRQFAADIFRPPNPSSEYKELLKQTKDTAQDVSDETIGQLASLANKNFVGQMILFIFKLATAGFLVYTVTTIAASMLRALAGVLVNAVAQLSPYLAAIFGLAFLIIAWEFFSSEISTAEQKERALRKMAFWRRKNSIDAAEKIATLKPVEDTQKISSGNKTQDQGMR